MRKVLTSKGGKGQSIPFRISALRREAWRKRRSRLVSAVVEAADYWGCGLGVGG